MRLSPALQNKFGHGFTRMDTDKETLGLLLIRVNPCPSVAIRAFPRREQSSSRFPRPQGFGDHLRGATGPLPDVVVRYGRDAFSSRDHRERGAGCGLTANSTTSGVRSLGAACASVRHVIRSAKMLRGAGPDAPQPRGEGGEKQMTTSIARQQVRRAPGRSGFTSASSVANVDRDLHITTSTQTGASPECIPTITRSSRHARPCNRSDCACAPSTSCK